jgi:hypothetical protein
MFEAGEILRPWKFSLYKDLNGYHGLNKVDSVIRYCQAQNKSGVVFDLGFNEAFIEIDKYKKQKDSYPVHTFSLYRANLLYLKICQTMDFQTHYNTNASYTVFENGTRTPTLDFHFARSRPANIRTHIDPAELQKFVYDQTSRQNEMKGSYTYVFAMENLYAYEYGNQFALQSVMEWKKVAVASGLHFRSFYRNYMMNKVNTKACETVRT